MTMLAAGGARPRESTPATVGSGIRPASIFVMLMLVLVGTGGCSQTNLAEILAEAAKDPASVCGSVMTPYGNLKFARTNIVNGNVVCNQDGLTVTSTTQTQVISTPPSGSFILIPQK